MVFGGFETVYDSAPFYPGFLEVDQQTAIFAGGFEVVEALGYVVGGEAFDAFEFYEEFVLDKEIGGDGSEVVAFVVDSEYGLRGGADSS